MARIVMFITCGILASAMLAGMTLGSLWLSSPLRVHVQNAPFVALISDQVGGSTWLNVTTAGPVDLSSADGRVELNITVSGAQSTTPTVILGGSLATGDANCVGASFGKATSKALELERSTLIQYGQRRPGTGRIDTVFDGSRSESVATKWLTREPLSIYRGIKLTNATTKTWSGVAGEPATDYLTFSSTLSCSFPKSSLVTQNSYLSRVQAPDVISSVGNLGDAGLTNVSYVLEVLASGSNIDVASTFATPTQRQDPTGVQVASYRGEWWTRNVSRPSGIALNGGSVVREPQSAQSWRAIARLLAGFFASLTVAAVASTIGFGFAQTKWWSDD